MDELEQKIYNGEILSEEELEELSCYDTVKTSYGENSRWQRAVEAIYKIGDKLFELDYWQGLTEYQDSSYPNQPYEVFKHTKKVTTTKTWYDTNKD